MVNPRCPKSCATEFTIRLVDVPISVQTPVICDTYDKGISALEGAIPICRLALITMGMKTATTAVLFTNRSEEHTSELQSRGHLVCRLLLEKKKKNKIVR